MLPLPLQFLAAWLAVWLGRVLQEQVDFLKAENRLLREKLGTKRIRLTNAERRRLAMLGKKLGKKGLAAVATIALPETILRWYRELVAKKYDGSERRGPGRPAKKKAPQQDLWARSGRQVLTEGCGLVEPAAVHRRENVCACWLHRAHSPGYDDPWIRVRKLGGPRCRGAAGNPGRRRRSQAMVATSRIRKERVVHR